MQNHSRANVMVFPAKATLKLGLDAVGREIGRAAVAAITRQANARDERSTAPTMERFQHGQTIEQYDGAVVDAGDMGHRVVDACLLDRLKEGGLLGKGDAALVRHSAGIWLRGLFDDSGLFRSVTGRLQLSCDGGDPQWAAAYEKSDHASRALAMYEGVLRAMEKRPWRHEGDGEADKRRRRRASHAVREISCWDNWPQSFTAHEVRRAFDRLAEMQGVEMGE